LETFLLDLTVTDGIATASMARSPVNAINSEWIDRFHSLLDALEQRHDWSVLLIRSTQRVFCAGADLIQISDSFAAPNGGDQMVANIERFHVLFARIERLPQVTIAEIGGAALGGGLEMALSCDLRIAANEAQLGLPEARLGLLPGAGGTQRLTWLCGKGVASRLILGAEIIDGKTACELGIVQWSVPRTELAGQSMEIALRVARLSPEALAASKFCIAASADLTRNGFAEELEATRQLFHSDETRKRVAAFFLERKAH
jgi:enoyl-CoA hydratase